MCRGCSSSRKYNASYSAYTQNRLTDALTQKHNLTSASDCKITEEEMREYERRLNCLSSKIPRKDRNKYLGLILTMLAHKVYCAYDLTKLVKLFEDYECN